MPVIRADLVEAHRESLDHVASPGAHFDGAARRRIAEAARDAYLDADPAPPWARPFGDAVLDGTVRLARHAGTLTEDWYRHLIADGVEATAWVEVVGVVIATVAPVAFARAAGIGSPALPAPAPGSPTGAVAASLTPATLNWVPVAAPADEVASVVQALSAVPAEWDNLWRLAEAQYMSDRAMDDPAWNRGTLSRPQMELLAGRISLIRECFF